MSMERFEVIVDAAKEQEIENSQNLDVIESQKNEIKALRKLLNDVKRSAIVEIKDTERLPEVMPVHEDERESAGHKLERNEGFKGVSKRPGVEKFLSTVGFNRAEDGKYTTKQVRRDTLPEAVVARNEIAAALLKEGLINFEKFLEYTQN